MNKEEVKQREQKRILGILEKTLDGEDFGIFATNISAYMTEFCYNGKHIVADDFTNYVRGQYVDRLGH